MKKYELHFRFGSLLCKTSKKTHPMHRSFWQNWANINGMSCGDWAEQ